ncbi:MAG: helix-turn-helix domain-containing protein [Pirellulaceae bacterium]
MQMQTASQSRLALRPKEAAKALGISTRTLWNWTRLGVVPSIRLGQGKRRSTLYPLEALNEWMAMQADKERLVRHG